MNTFLQKMFTPPAPTPAEKLSPLKPIIPGNVQFGKNPFMVAINNDSKDFEETYGKNKPLNKPMFLGYDEDNKAIYGGSRLFVLY